MDANAPKPTMKIKGLVREYKLEPHQMTERLTPETDLFVLAHMGVPEIAKQSWRLIINGLIDRPLEIGFEELLRRPKKVVETIHQCAGSPVNPTVPTRQIANVKWTGVDLQELFSEAEVHSNATHVWAYGLDHGSMAGEDQDFYLKDVPLSRVEDGDVLIAYELNGEPLSAKHGFPARLIVPGFFGTNSVKWLSRLRLSDVRARSIFTTKFYNDPVPESDATTPVWEIAPESVIVAPAQNGKVKTGETEIWGWAWSSCEVDKVEISGDGGHSWNLADLEPRTHRSWQRFSGRWSAHQAGIHELLSKATDVRGRAQPMEGARNAVYLVSVVVED